MRKSQLTLPVLSEGINLIDDTLIADNEAAIGTQNISFKNGIPTTRKGYIKDCTHNFSSEVHTLVNYVKNGTRIVLAAAGTTLYKKTSSSIFTAITGTLASDVISTLTYPFKFADPDTYSDKCFILDGTNYRYYNDDGTLTDVTAYSPTTDEQTKYGTNVLSTTPDEIKKQKWIINDNDRVWVAGYGKLVRLSHLSKPDYFPSSQVWKLSEDCTGLVQFSDEVLMFTENTATLIKGSTPDWSLPDKYIRRSLPVNYGCSQHRSIAKGNGALYWASRGGVFRYLQLPDGTYEPQCISEVEVKRGSKKHIKSVKAYIEAVTDWSKVFAVFCNNEYRLCLGDMSWLVWDAIGSTWSYYVYDKVFNHAIAYHDTLYSAKSYYYLLDKAYDEGSYDGLSDDGTAIDFKLKSKFYNFEKAANKKKFKKFFFTIKSDYVSYDIDLIINIDNQYISIQNQIYNKVSRWGEFLFGDKVSVNTTNLNYPIRINHSGKKYNIQYELDCNTLNQAFSLIDTTLLLKIKELK